MYFNCYHALLVIKVLIKCLKHFLIQLKKSVELSVTTSKWLNEKTLVNKLIYGMLSKTLHYILQVIQMDDGSRNTMWTISISVSVNLTLGTQGIFSVLLFTTVSLCASNLTPGEYIVMTLSLVVGVAKNTIKRLRAY